MQRDIRAFDARQIVTEPKDFPSNEPSWAPGDYYPRKVKLIKKYLPSLLAAQVLSWP